MDLELFHDVRPVGFNGLDADVELLGDLAVHAAGDHQLEHLALALRELGKTRAVNAAALVALARLGIALDAILHHRHHAPVVERLLDEVDRALLHRAHRLGHVGAARQEDHRQQHAALLEVLLQVEAVHSRHVEVDHEATGHIGLVFLQEAAGIGKDLGAQPVALHEPRQQLTRGAVVVDDEHSGLAHTGTVLNQGLAGRITDPKRAGPPSLCPAVSMRVAMR